MAGAGIFVLLLFYALIAYVLYWIVRLGVRHGLQDVERRPPAPPVPPPPPVDPAD